MNDRTFLEEEKRWLTPSTIYYDDDDFTEEEIEKIERQQDEDNGEYAEYWLEIDEQIKLEALKQGRTM
jgi:hypothetical protein